MANNKVKYGLSNVHYAKITGYTDGKYTFGTVKPVAGAVNLSMDPEGEIFEVFADNIIYYSGKTNAGYSGDLEIMNITDEFRQDILGEVLDDSGVQIENSDAQGSEFAFMFQFEGDVSAKRHIMWRCAADRPSVSSKTKEKTTEPNTDTLTLKAMARENDHNIKGFCYNETATQAIYNNWFTSVWEPVTATPTTTSFDKNGGTDLTFTCSETPTGVKNGTTALTLTTDYTFSGKAVTVKSTYLETLTTDEDTTLTITSAAGNANVKISVTDSTGD